MRKFISKTFGLRDGEIHISFLMQLYIFIIITVLLIVKPTINALFVSKLGADNLPIGYLLVAFTAVISSYFYSRAIRKFSLVKVTLISLIVFSITFLILGIILKFSFLSDWLLYFYYVFVSLFAVVATSQFWIFANMVFNVREAKRIFGFIGAGAIAGGIFGGYLTSLIASSFGSEFTIILAGILILGCIPILRKVYYLKIRYLNTFRRKQVIANQDSLENSSVRLILKSKHLTYIALIIGIGVIVAKLVDFQFSDFAHKAIPDPDDLAAFFGFWFSTFNVIALTIQLFITNKVLTRLGVSSTLLILPLAIALGCLLFLTFPELWVLIIIKGIDGSFKQSINKAAIELSIMPIPLLVKNQAKSFIDVVIDSVATGFAGFLLIFLIKKLNLNTSYVTIIVVLFVFVWIILIYKLREAYFNSFKENIQRNIKFDNDSEKKNKQENNIAGIIRVLENGDEESILSLLSRLKNYDTKTFNKQVIKLLNNPSNKVKAEAIDYFDEFVNEEILSKVKELVYENDDRLVYMSLDYILNHSSFSEEGFFDAYLDHQNEYIANAALMSLSKIGGNNSKLANKYNLHNRLESKIPFFTSDENIRKEVIAGLMMSIAFSKMSVYYKHINENLKSKSNYIVKFAITAAGITSDELFIENLLDLTRKKKHRKKAIRSLKSYGPKIIDSILKLNNNEQIKGSVKKYIPKIIESFSNEKAVRVLIQLLKSKVTQTRLQASISLQKLKQREISFGFSRRLVKNQVLKESTYYRNILEISTSLQHIIYTETLEEENKENSLLYKSRKELLAFLDDDLNNSLQSIFNLLGIIYNKNDVEMTFIGIQSEIKEARINSLEFLDNMLRRNIKTLLMPIIEHYILEDNNLNTALIDLKVLPEKEYLQKLIKIGSSDTRFLALQVILSSRDKNYLPVLLPIKKYRNQNVKKLANDTYKVLESL